MRRTQTNTFLLHQSLINHQEEDERRGKGGEKRSEKNGKEKKKKDRFFLFFPPFVLSYLLHAHYSLFSRAYHLLGEKKTVRFFFYCIHFL